MSGTVSQGQGVTAALPISAGYYPEEGSRVCGATYSWLGNNRQYNEDLSYWVGEGLLTTIQSIYIDNSQCQFPVSIQIAGSNQLITVPGLTMAVAPAFFYGGGRFKIAGVSSNNTLGILTGSNDNYTKVYFLNIPLGAEQWTLGGNVTAGLLVYRSQSNAADGTYYTILSSMPTDCRIVLLGLQVEMDFVTAPTSAGTALFTLNDNGLAIFGQRINWAAGDGTPKIVNIGAVSYLQRFVGSPIAMRLIGFPAGAANLFMTASSNISLIPQVA